MKKAEAYIDTVITVFLNLIIVYVVLSLFSYMITYQKINKLSDNIIRYAAVSGNTSEEIIGDKIEEYIVGQGFKKEDITISFDGTDYCKDNYVQYGDTIALTVSTDKVYKFVGKSGTSLLKISSGKVSASEKYYRSEVQEEPTTINMFPVYNYGFSAVSINVPTASKTKQNSYGTTISNTEANNILKVSQAKYGVPTNTASYNNGYFTIGINGLEEGKNYTFSFRFNVKEELREVVLTDGVYAKTNNILSGVPEATVTDSYTSTNEKVWKYTDNGETKYYCDVGNPLNTLDMFWLLNGSSPNGTMKRTDNLYFVTFTLPAGTNSKTTKRYIEIRPEGKSGTFTNFTLTEN